MSEDGTKPNKSFVQELKFDWKLLWHSILGDESFAEEVEGTPEELLMTGKLERLSLEQVKALTKALSQNRRVLNQKLEVLTKELDLNSAKLESLRLVGGETQSTEEKNHSLSDQGLRLSEELAKIDSNLKLAHEREHDLQDL